MKKLLVHARSNRRSPGAHGARVCTALLACIGVALALGVVGQAAGSAPSFARPTPYEFGGASFEDVAIADLNGDRKLDLAVTNEISSVYVLLNSGQGKFRGRRSYRTGADPAAMAIGDLNGDAKPDLVTANRGDGDGKTVSVLLNSGDAGFEARRDYGTGEQPESVAIGDLNGDSKPDVVTANQTGETVSVLANGGDGTLRDRRDYRAGASPVAVAIADLNGDRKPDLATANSDGASVSVLASRGDGTFAARRNYGAGESPEKVASGDLNSDGKPDLAITNGVADTGTLSVLRNTTGLCTVPNLRGKTRPVATKAVARANCRLGKIRRVYSKIVKTGRVISQTPKPGKVLRRGAKVNLVVSLGRMR